METYKITVELDDGHKLILEFPYDINIYEIADYFRTIMNFLTFTPEQIKEIIPKVEE